MRIGRLDELQVQEVLDGGVVSLPAAPGFVLRVRLMKGSMVIDTLAEEVYNKRHGVVRVGGSDVATLDNP